MPIFISWFLIYKPHLEVKDNIYYKEYITFAFNWI